MGEPGGLRIGIALGAGAARGLAHLGVLSALKEAGIPYHMLAGTSMGAAVAALVACGQDPDRLGRLAGHLSWERLIRVGLPRLGLLRTDRLEAFLRLLTRETPLESLPVPAYLVACDLERGERVVLDRGPIVPAILASCAVPGIFPPVRWEGRLLVDGGVLERVPARVLRERGAELVVAVDVGLPHPGGRIRNIFDCILHAIDVMQREIESRQEVAWDVLIRPDLGPMGPTRFDRAPQCIAAGLEAGRAAVPEIRRRMTRESREERASPAH